MPVAAQKATRSSRSRKVIRIRHPRFYDKMPYQRAETRSEILHRAIKRELGGTTSFTREDLIHLSTFKHIATISRYHTVCILVRFLIDNGSLVAMDKTNLCLTEHQDAWVETPLRDRYYDTIRAIVTGKFKRNANISVMDIVDEWKTDTDLTVNNKRVAVRGALSRLKKDGILVQEDEFEYTVQSVAH